MSGSLLQSIANPPNPLTQLQQTASGIDALRSFQGKQATANAYQQAIDPTTGQLDQGRFNALLASTPQGAWNIGPTMQQAGQTQSAQGVGQQQQIAAKLAQLQGISGYMQPLLNKTLQGQPVSGQDVLTTLGQAQAAGLVTPEMAANIQKQVASLGPNGDATNLVRGAYFATGTGMQQLQAMAPPTQPVDIGSVTVPLQTHPLAPGAFMPGQALPMGMSPAQANQMVTVNMPSGRPQQMTMQQWIAASRASPALQGLNPGGPQPVAGAADLSAGFGPNQGRLAPPPAAAGATVPVTRTPLPAPAATTMPAPSYGTAPEPGAVEAATTAAGGSAQDQVAFRRDLPAAQGRIFTAQQALGALQGADTGPGGGYLQAVNGILGTYAPDVIKELIPSYDPQKQAVNYDLANKYLAQIAMANANRMGPGTDAKLAAAFTGNPNTHIQNLAAQDILKVQIGLDRMNQAMGDDMQDQNIPPQDFATWRGQWARNHDPRAFVVDSMPPDQRQAMVRSLTTPQQKSIFRQTLDQAIAGGYVSNPIAPPVPPAAPMPAPAPGG